MKVSQSKDAARFQISLDGQASQPPLPTPLSTSQGAPRKTAASTKNFLMRIKPRTSFSKISSCSNISNLLPKKNDRDFDFLQRPPFNRDRFFKEVCRITQPDKELLIETLRHFESQSKERNIKAVSSVGHSTNSIQPKAFNAKETAPSKALQSSDRDAATNAMFLKEQQLATNAIPVQTLNVDIADSTSKGRLHDVFSTQCKDPKPGKTVSTMMTQRKLRVNSNSLFSVKNAEVSNSYDFGANEYEIFGMHRKAVSSLQDPDCELADGPNNLYAASASKSNPETKELADLLQIHTACSMSDILASVKRIKAELDLSVSELKELKKENELLKTRIAITENVNRPPDSVEAYLGNETRPGLGLPFRHPLSLSQLMAFPKKEKRACESTMFLTSATDELDNELTLKKSPKATSRVHCIKMNGGKGFKPGGGPRDFGDVLARRTPKTRQLCNRLSKFG